MTPAEEAAALAVLVRQHDWSLRQVAAAIHKSHAYVSQRLRVFENQDLRAPVLEQQLSVSAAEELLRVPVELRRKLVDQAVREHWTPAQARAARLSARTKWLESNHLQSNSAAVMRGRRSLTHRAHAQGSPRVSSLTQCRRSFVIIVEIAEGSATIPNVSAAWGDA